MVPQRSEFKINQSGTTSEYFGPLQTHNTRHTLTQAHHHKGCPNRETKQAKCANFKGPHVASYKGCPAYKKQAFRQHVVDNQKSYASILRQNLAPPQPKDKAFTFSADQLVKSVANVVIQVAQSQVCYTNPTQDAIDKKSSLCRRVSEAAKTHLGVNSTGINLFTP